MKPYQDHCPVADKGKATPHPKRPTQAGRFTGTRHVSGNRSERLRIASGFDYRANGGFTADKFFRLFSPGDQR